MKYFSEFIQNLIRASTQHFKSIQQVSRLQHQQFLRYFIDKEKMPKKKYFSKFIQKLITSSTHHY